YHQFTLVDEWNGSTWTIIASPDPGGAGPSVFQGVACPAPTACVAVGYYFDNPTNSDRPLIANWNGSTWIQAQVSGESVQYPIAISCSSVSACSAIGNSAGAMEAWTLKGSSWTTSSPPAVPSSFSNSLAAIGCASSTWCVVVGTYNKSKTSFPLPLADSWDGS